MPEEERLALADAIREGLVQLGWLSSQFTLTVSDSPEPDRILVTLDTSNESYSLIRLHEEPAYQLAFRLNSLATRQFQDPIHSSFSSSIAAALRTHGLEPLFVSIRPTETFSLHVTVTFPSYGCDLEVEESLFRDPNGTIRIADRIISLLNGSHLTQGRDETSPATSESARLLPKTALERILNEEEFV